MGRLFGSGGVWSAKVIVANSFAGAAFCLNPEKNFQRRVGAECHGIDIDSAGAAKYVY